MAHAQCVAKEAHQAQQNNHILCLLAPRGPLTNPKAPCFSLRAWEGGLLSSRMFISRETRGSAWESVSPSHRAARPGLHPAPPASRDSRWTKGAALPAPGQEADGRPAEPQPQPPRSPNPATLRASRSGKVGDPFTVPWTRFQRLCNPSLSLPFSNARAACLRSGSQAPGEREGVQETLGVAVAGSATFPRLGWKLSSWLPERLGRLWVPPPGVHAPLTLPYPQLPRPGGSPILSCPGNSHSSVLPHS